MTRFHVHVVHMRARDIRKGDVVARDPSRQEGWFRVHEVKSLPDGHINILDKGNVRGFLAGPFDLIGLQTPVPLPAEADATARRRDDPHAGPGDPSATPSAATSPGPSGPGAAIPVPAAPASTDAAPPGDSNAREAAARALQAEAQRVRGSLPQ